MENKINCHKNAPRFLTTEIEWEQGKNGNSSCSYCGSLKPEDIKRIVAEGGKMGGSDWKYGYPHKFYVYPTDGTMYKFYTDHLEDLDGIELTEFAKLLLQQTGIEFSRTEEGIYYKAPYLGYQR